MPEVPHDSYTLEQDGLFKILLDGTATAEEQRHAAEWIRRLYEPLREIRDGSVGWTSHTKRVSGKAITMKFRTSAGEIAAKALDRNF